MVRPEDTGIKDGATPRPEGRTSERASLPEAVHVALRKRILNNEFTAGERLIEMKIAEEYGVSRTTLRSALRELANENLVVITQRHGCFVARMSQRDVEDSLYARFLLEVGAACDDLSWITDEVLERLEAQIDAMMSAALEGDMASIADADTAFHGVIVSAAGRSRVTELWHMLDGQMGSVMRSSLDQMGIDMTEIVERHRSLIDAVRSRDVAAIQEAIRVHYLERDGELSA